MLPLSTTGPKINEIAAQKLIPPRSVPLKMILLPSGPRRKTTLRTRRLMRTMSPCLERWDCRNWIGLRPKEIALPMRGK